MISVEKTLALHTFEETHLQKKHSPVQAETKKDVQGHF